MAVVALGLACWAVYVGVTWPAVGWAIVVGASLLVGHHVLRVLARRRVWRRVASALDALARQEISRLASLAADEGAFALVELDLDVTWLSGDVTRHACLGLWAEPDDAEEPLAVLVGPPSEIEASSRRERDGDSTAYETLLAGLPAPWRERSTETIAGSGAVAIASHPWRAPRARAVPGSAEVMARIDGQWRRGVVSVVDSRGHGPYRDEAPGLCRVSLDGGGSAEVASGDAVLASDAAPPGTPGFGEGDRVLGLDSKLRWRRGAVAERFGPLRLVRFAARGQGEAERWLGPDGLQLVGTRRGLLARRVVGTVAAIAVVALLAFAMVATISMDPAPAWQEASALPEPPPPPPLAGLPAVGDTVLARSRRHDDYCEVARVAAVEPPVRVGVTLLGTRQAISWHTLGDYELFGDTIGRGTRASRSNGNTISPGVVLRRARTNPDEVVYVTRGARAATAVPAAELLVGYRELLRAAPGRPLAPLAASPAPGERVLARLSETEFCFPAVVSAVAERDGAPIVSVAYDDGDRAELDLADLFEDSLRPGARASARIATNTGDEWFAGIVALRRDEGLRIYFDDGDVGEVPRAAVRVRCPARGPSTSP
jgi:hypothetical protein